MAATKIASGNWTDSAPSDSHDLTFDCGTGENREMFVFVFAKHSSDPDILTPTYNSVSITPVDTKDYGAQAMYSSTFRYTLGASITGSNTLNVSFTTAPTAYIAFAIVFDAISEFDPVHKTDEMSNFGGSDYTALSQTTTIANVVNICAGGWKYGSGFTFTVGTGFTEEFEVSTGAHSTDDLTGWLAYEILSAAETTSTPGSASSAVPRLGVQMVLNASASNFVPHSLLF